MRNFIKIGDIINNYMELYKECIELIPHSDFSEKEVQDCVGKDFILFNNDIDYLRKSIISIFDNRIKQFFVLNCY